MPRTEAMFVRFILQIRLFVTRMGANYECPKDDIVESGRRLLDAIHARDVDAELAAWRSKDRPRRPPHARTTRRTMLGVETRPTR
ncbi:hypothetical protein ACWEK5_18885 [Rhodococcus koreensis]